MRQFFLKIAALSLAGWFLSTPLVRAQSAEQSQSITFNSLNATYYLSRDNQNQSLLTTEEVILADFPANSSYYGITRSIPLKYQGRSVNVKVNSVTDAGGNSVPFKTKTDSQDNLIVTTGDPDITLYGYQTFRINYQTQDVINTNLKNNQFLLDINGRGWRQAFGSVTGIIHIPKAFASSLIGIPSCYIGYLSTTANDCTVKTKTNSSETVVTVKSNGSVPAQHTLVSKISFKTATFLVKDSLWQKNRIFIVVVGTVFLLGATRFLFKRA